MNNNIQKALKYAQMHIKRNYRIDNNQKVINYLKTHEFDWENICEFSRLIVNKEHVTKFTLLMVIYLVKNNMYQGKYKDKLKSDIRYLEMFAEGEHFKSIASILFHKKYEEIHYVLRNKNNQGLTVIKMSIKNPELSKLYIDFWIECGFKAQLRTDLLYWFPESVGEVKINSYKSLNDITFWNQIEYYKNISANKNLKKSAIRVICNFYRWLLQKYKDHNFFENSLTITNELLFSSSLVNEINKNAYFTTLTKYEDLSNYKNVCFITRNLDIYSTKTYKTSFLEVNAEKLKISYYREILFKYIQNANTVSLLINPCATRMIIKTLSFIEKIKSRLNYPNPDYKSFNTNEAILIRDFYSINKKNYYTINNNIGVSKRFFIWCKKNNLLFFDTMFFDFMSQVKEPKHNGGQTIPDKDLQLIDKTFVNEANKNIELKKHYAIFRIAIETEFRISQICNIKLDSIKPSFKNDQYYILSNTKTSHGRKRKQIISMSTVKILKTIINETQQLRNELVSEAYKNNIFIIKGRLNSIKPINSSIFLNVFQNICEIAGVKRYNSRNIRDTHMTKSYEYITNNNRNELELGILTGHKSSTTTKKYYIEMELTKMLETTHNILLNDKLIQQKDQIKKKLPNAINNEKNVVENGCGNCNSSKCNTSGMLPCLSCEHFITTPSHKKYFENSIKIIDDKIKNSIIAHQKEDYIITKKLLVNWLLEISKFEEENYGN